MTQSRPASINLGGPMALTADEQVDLAVLFRLIEFNFDEKNKRLVAWLGGDAKLAEISLFRREGGKLAGTFDEGADAIMRIPLHDVDTVAEAKREIVRRLPEAIAKSKPEFARQAVEHFRSVTSDPTDDNLI